jgi:hypothetical protein
VATVIHDLVCIYIDSKPAFFARIEEIVADVKPGWWQVRLLILTHPLQIFTWILEESQINGAPFTMGGTPVYLDKIVSPVLPLAEESPDSVPQTVRLDEVRKGPAKVVSLKDRMKDK